MHYFACMFLFMYFIVVITDRNGTGSDLKGSSSSLDGPVLSGGGVAAGTALGADASKIDIVADRRRAKALKV